MISLFAFFVFIMLIITYIYLYIVDKKSDKYLLISILILGASFNLSQDKRITYFF